MKLGQGSKGNKETREKVDKGIREKGARSSSALFPLSPFPLFPYPLIPFLAALQFLTIVPPVVRRPFTPAELGRAVGFFPLVGLLLGSVLALLAWGLGRLFPPGVTAALALAAWVALTGALHLDGFLDTCDGVLGGRIPEERLRILRDERVGAYAVAGGVLLLLVKYAALAALAGNAGTSGRSPWADGLWGVGPFDRTPLLLAPVLGRWEMALAVVAFPYARREGLGRAMKDRAGWGQTLLAGATALGVAVVVAGWAGLAAWGLATGAMLLLARFTLRRLPGLTGDVYGAVCEVVEAFTLLVFAAF